MTLNCSEIYLTLIVVLEKFKAHLAMLSLDADNANNLFKGKPKTLDMLLPKKIIDLNSSVWFSGSMTVLMTMASDSNHVLRLFMVISISHVNTLLWKQIPVCRCSTAVSFDIFGSRSC